MIPAKLKISSARQRAWYALALIMTIAAAGCGPRADDGRVPVTGSIIFAGQPVTHGTVLFATKSGRGDASAVIDASGRFQVRLVPEDYTVVVRSTEGDDHLDQQGRFIAAKKLVPERYFDCRTSDLRMTVQPAMPPVELTLRP